MHSSEKGDNVLKELIKVAEKLYSIGRAKEANFVDSLIKRFHQILMK